ncbi:MAG: peptidylprolyl isomerase [Chthoniobacterales bacterium]
MHLSHLKFRIHILAAVMAFASVFSARAENTFVRLDTSVGTMDIELYDSDKPITVRNFLSYVNSGAYASNFVHRLVPGFIVQGGGFGIADGSLFGVTAGASIVSEYTSNVKFSNTKGSIAMAQVGTDPNSATCQWFINLADNDGTSGNNLNTLNGGFTVFGRVIRGSGVLDIFNSFPTSAGTGPRVYNKTAQLETALGMAAGSLGTLFDELPMFNDTLQIGDFVFTQYTVLPPPTLTVNGKHALKTKKTKVSLSGKANGSVENIEWKVNNGPLQTMTAKADWTLQIAGLKRGKKTKVYVRGTYNGGQRVSAFQMVQITRSK